MNLVEAFSGIGSQFRALQEVDSNASLLNTIEWDINSIIAYDIINHKDYAFEPNLVDRAKIIKELSNKTFSMDGKTALSSSQLLKYPTELLERLYYSIIRNKNLGSIVDVTYNDIPENTDILTYSFPCQDLSIASFWHGNFSGIDRDAGNRSGMLWEIERILKEMHENGRSMPRILIMENVNAVISPRHNGNFSSWRDKLEEMSYYNHIYELTASDFGIPQKRKRLFMISIKYKNHEEKTLIERYFNENNLECPKHRDKLGIKNNELEKFLKIDYSETRYFNEAKKAQPNKTKSRLEIYEGNQKLIFNDKIINENIKTITTKQDRNPNSGVIDFSACSDNKADFRYLTPRECLLLMGFKEKDFDRLMYDHNFQIRKNGKYFTDAKVYKMAGNSIVVNILIEIFEQVVEINKILGEH